MGGGDGVAFFFFCIFHASGGKREASTENGTR